NVRAGREESHEMALPSTGSELSNLSDSAGERSVLICRASAGWGRHTLLGSRVDGDQLGNLLAGTLRIGRGFVAHEAGNSPQMSQEVREAVQPEACLAVPIVKERDVIGVLVLFDRQDPRRFGDPDLARAAIVASQAGLAISNARLYQESQRRAK